MRRHSVAIALFIIAFLMIAVPSFANNRTFVSNTGVDTGSGPGTCGATNPCKNFSYAIVQTNAGGDIMVLDDGGYGQTFTINKAINIVVPPGVYASMSPSVAGQTAIVIAAGASDIIRIDGLNLLGQGPAQNQTGVSVGTCKRVELRNMQMRNLAQGVHITANVKAFLNRLNISNVTTGIKSIGTNGGHSSGLKVYATGINIMGASRGISVDSGAFYMPQANGGGEPNLFGFITQDAYIIDSDVASCSQVSITQNFTNFVGVFKASCDCQVQDLRDGSITQGNCDGN